MRWIPIAMVRIVAVFICGVLSSIWFPELITQQKTTVFLIVFTLSYFPSLWIFDKSSAIGVATGAIGLCAVFLAGYKSVHLRNESLRSKTLIGLKSPVHAYKVKLLSVAEEKGKFWRCTGRVVAAQTSTGWLVSDGKIFLLWPKQEKVTDLDYGDLLLVKGHPAVVAGPQNPHEFDYRQFLSWRNIFHQHHIRSGDWKVIQRSTDHGFLFFASRARAWTTGVIEKYVKGAREQAIVKAFVIGVTDGIDDELKQAYAAGGAMHVLAVSGLHVGILYGILLLFLRRLEKMPGGKWILAALSLVVLWSYAFITGLSPSVLRAVTMFSFMAIANPIRRSQNIYNTLAASAFVLLMYDPFLIMSVGFQLSYLAVLGIVALYRPLYNLLEPKWSWLDWMWQITCISMAAQLATVALTLFYFHQFPVYFLIANLFVIPVSTVILLGGMGLLVISSLDWLATWLGTALEAIVYGLNYLLFQVERLPYSVIDSIQLSVVHSMCLLAFIVGVFFLLSTKRFYWIVALTLVAIVFSLASWNRITRISRLTSFTVYRVAGQSALEWVSQSESYFMADSVLLINEERIRFQVAPSRVGNGTKRAQTASTNKGIGFFRFGGKSFLWINANDAVWPGVLTTNYLIIGRNAISPQLLQRINFDYLIFDSSNSLRYCERMEGEAKKLRKPCFSVLNHGAFTLKL